MEPRLFLFFVNSEPFSLCYLTGCDEDGPICGSLLEMLPAPPEDERQATLELGSEGKKGDNAGPTRPSHMRPTVGNRGSDNSNASREQDEKGPARG